MTKLSTAAKIAIGVDGSHHAVDAVKFYLERLHKPGNHVVLIHVEEPFSTHDMTVALTTGRYGTVNPDLWRKVLEHEQNKVNVMKTEIEARIPSDVSYSWCLPGEGGDPGQQIIAAAKQECCGLIVVGTRGLSTLRRTLLGSVSDFIIHHSAIPVVVCPSKDQAEL